MNWGLAIACIALVLIFQESSKLAAAFGLAVSGTMLITSVIFYVVTRNTWGWPLWKAGGLLVFFLSFDVPFLVANMLKFFDGGYLPFMVGVFFVIVMIVWRIGRGLLSKHYAKQALPLDDYLANLDDKIVARIPGTALMMSSQSNGVPPVLYRTVRRFKVVHETVILLTVEMEHTPNVPLTRRVKFEEIGKGFFRITLHFGFIDEPDVPKALEPILSRLPGSPALADLVYVIGRETVVAQEGGDMSFVSESIFAVLMRNARAATDYFKLPPEQVVELAKHIDL
jgi:KUP system potassium uptake protein